MEKVYSDDVDIEMLTTGNFESAAEGWLFVVFRRRHS